MTLQGEVEAFQQALEKVRREFPIGAIRELLIMAPGPEQDALALRVLPSLLRMANRTLEGRWRNAVTDPPPCGEIVTGHIVGAGGGFSSCWYSGGKWWVTDFVASKFVKREVRVTQWRLTEGCLAEPWHDDSAGMPPPLTTETPEPVKE
jgi:hypothetical protein